MIEGQNHGNANSSDFIDNFIKSLPSVDQTIGRQALEKLIKYNRTRGRNHFDPIEPMQITWQILEEKVPIFAKKFLNEYQRVKGMIPYENGYVYIIHGVETNYYKIGKTKVPDQRILQISPKTPFPIRYVMIYPTYFMSEAEKYLHKRFQEQRTHGEWFELTLNDIALILHNMAFKTIRYVYCKKISSLITE